MHEQFATVIELFYFGKSNIAVFVVKVSFKKIFLALFNIVDFQKQHRVIDPSLYIIVLQVKAKIFTDAEETHIFIDFYLLETHRPIEFP